MSSTIEASDADIALLREYFLLPHSLFRRYFSSPSAEPFQPMVFNSASDLLSVLLKLGWLSPQGRCFIPERWLSNSITKPRPPSPLNASWIVRDRPKPVALGPSVSNFSWPDEAELLVQLAWDQVKDLPKGSRVLDMCTGSGALAIWLCQMRSDLIIDSVDSSANALRDVTLNLRLNNIPVSRVRMVESDLFENPVLRNARYDLILADPPFSLSPDFVEGDSYAHGGPLGDGISRRILCDAPQYLKNQDSRILMLTYSLGGDDAHSLAVLREPGEVHLNIREPLILKDSKVWRFRHHKMFSNPMPVEMMIIRLADSFRKESQLARLDNPSDSSIEFVSLYENWIARHKRNSMHKLWYVLIDGSLKC